MTEPRIIRYETEGMTRLREQLILRGFTDHEIDTFKSCLIMLEREGFHLVKKS